MKNKGPCYCRFYAMTVVLFSDSSRRGNLQDNCERFELWPCSVMLIITDQPLYAFVKVDMGNIWRVHYHEAVLDNADRDTN